MGEAAEEILENEEVVDEVTNDIVEDDDDEKVVEPWQLSDEDDGSVDDVPVGTHIKMKQKLKGRISDRDDEISNLRTEIESLKKGSVKPQGAAPGKRPRSDDFDTDEEYENALDEWHDARFESREIVKKQNEASSQAATDLKTSTDQHYERAGTLVEKSGISSENFKISDSTVRNAIESVRPKQGDLIVDQLISMIGEGSEKVFYFLGRNKTALNEVKSLLTDDPSGMKAAIYLGQQKQRLTNPTKRTSNAPNPAPEANGDDTPKPKEKALKRKYVEAHKKGGGQPAYNLLKEARAAGFDTKSW